MTSFDIMISLKTCNSVTSYFMKKLYSDRGGASASNFENVM